MQLPMKMNRRELSKFLAVAAGAFAVSGGKSLGAETLLAKPQASRGGRKRAGNSLGIDDLMREPLAPIPNAEVTVLTLTLAPGETGHPHRHTGPVFAYILEGSIENQVDPEPAKTYRRGDYFYEPPLHVHRQMKNLSDSAAAKVLVFQVGEKGKPFTIAAS